MSAYEPSGVFKIIKEGDPRLKVDIYLRKSRADEELEKTIGQGETLARHRAALLRLAKERNYTIVNIHEELVSGEELYFRPAMLEVLKDVENRLIEGILVMDIQRFGRGDTEEQGYILKKFKAANIKIITPGKIYDLSNEFDEDYLEFEAFMGRKEYKMITRRMQGGRIRSVEEGNYIATLPPYGYDILRVDKKTRTLTINEEQAKVVRMIFDLYVNHGMGYGSIAKYLNELGIKPYSSIRKLNNQEYSGKWDGSMIGAILKRQIYVGNVVWKAKKIKKSKTPGKKKDVKLRPKSQWVICKGKHPPIIDPETFEKAQAILAGKYHPPYQVIRGLANPLAGLVVCGICGAKMQRRPYVKTEPFLICSNKCGIKSNRFSSVEKAVIEELKKYLHTLEIKLEAGPQKPFNDEIALLTQNLNELKNELKTLETQHLKTFDLLEQGIYDVATFKARSELLSNKITEVKNAIKTCEAKIQSLNNANDNLNNTITQIKNVIDIYPTLDEPKDKNMLLKGILEKVEYYKEKDWGSDEFRLKLYPKTSFNSRL